MIAPSTSRRSWQLAKPVRVALRLAVPVAVVAVLVQVLDMGRISELLRLADVGLLAAGLGALLVQNALSAVRWRLTAGRLGVAMGLRAALGAFFRSQLVNMTLPGGVLGDAERAVRSQGDAGLWPAGQAVVIDRAVGQAALFAVLIAGLVLWAMTGDGVLAVPASLRAPVSVWVPVVAFGALAAFWAAARINHVRDRLRRIAAPLRASVLAPGAWPAQLVLSVLIVACNIAGVAFCAAATGAALPALALVTLVPLVLVAMVVPVSVAGWGVREGAAAALWPLAGLSAEAGVAASAAFGFMALAASLPGAATFLARR